MSRAVGNLFVVFVVVAVAFAFSERSDPPQPPTAIRITQLQMLDVAEGAGGRLIGVGERGNIFLSDDRGASWRSATTPSAATLTAVRFVDARHAVAVGHDAVILRSADAGDNWQLVQSDPEAEEPLLSLWFDADGRGFAVGAYGRFVETTDGGTSWTERELAANPEGLHLNAVARVADAVYLIAGEAGTLLRSDDGGQAWTALSSPYAGSFFGVQVLADGAVLAYGMRGHVFRSTDRGDNWVEIDSGAHASLFGGRVLADGRVVLVGQAGLVLVSADQGRSFVRVPGPDRLTRTAVFEGRTGGQGGLVLVGEEGVAPMALPAHSAGGA